MNEWWDDFLTLMFKRATLAWEDATDLVSRYLATLWRVTIIGSLAMVGLLALLILSAVLNVSWGWVYLVLIGLMAAVLLTATVVALPILLLLQAGYEFLPRKLQVALLKWQRRGGAALFGALLTMVFISVFRLWEWQGDILIALLIIATLGIGGGFGWWKITDQVRQAIAIKLIITLLAIAIVARFPLVGEVVEWVGDRSRAAIFHVTRSTPEPYLPTSANELREAFVHRGTGEFRIWYSQDEQGNYEVFKSPGYDRFGSPLTRAETPEQFAAMLDWQRQQDRAREVARQAREEEASRRRAREEQDRRELRDRLMVTHEELYEAAGVRLAKDDFDGAQRLLEEARQVAAGNQHVFEDRVATAMRGELDQLLRRVEVARAEQLRLASYLAALPDERVNYIVFFALPSGEPFPEITSAIVDHLSTTGVSAAGGVFTRAFMSPEGLDAFVAGRGGADIAALKLDEVADRLLLIRGSDRMSRPSASVARVETYSMNVTVVAINASDGRRLTEFLVRDVTGAGATEAAAKSAFAARFAQRILETDALFSGLP